MTVKVITTLHKDGYDLYGQKNLNSWANYFPKDWKMVYYAEKHSPELNERTTIVDFDECCPEWNNFYDVVKQQLNRDPAKDDPKRINWYKKALRWSFKMYAVLHALKNTDTRYLVWLDADVVATASPTADWIEKCLKNTCMAAQLEFIKAGGHIETGILIFDLHHPDIHKIYDWIKTGYVDGEILKEEKAWDGIWMAKLVQTNTVSWNNIDMVIYQNVARAFSDPRMSWLTHRVGKNKFRTTVISARSGRSPGQELI